MSYALSKNGETSMEENQKNNNNGVMNAAGDSVDPHHHHQQQHHRQQQQQQHHHQQQQQREEDVYGYNPNPHHTHQHQQHHHPNNYEHRHSLHNPNSPHHHHHRSHLPYDVEQASHEEEQENSLLWDELNNQHSREIIYHKQNSKKHPLHYSDKKIEIANQLKSAYNTTKDYIAHIAATKFTDHSPAKNKGQSSELWNKPYKEEDVEEMHRLALAEFGLASTPTRLDDQSDLLLKEESRTQFSSMEIQPSSSIWPSKHTLNSPLLSTTTTTTNSPPSKKEASYTFTKTGLWEKITDAKSKFVFLSKYKLLPKRDGWAGVANLDLFFTSLYNYYYHRGIVPIIGKGVVELISLFFTLWLSVFLFAYLDWHKLAKCTDEETCEATLSDYVIDKPFSKTSFWNFLVVLYCLLFLIYGAFSIATFLASVSDALDAKIFFEDKLGVCARKLEGGAVEWDEIVRKFMELQKSGECRVALHGECDNIDELTVAQRILRKENFMVAFINKDLLDLTVPLPWPLSKGGDVRSKMLFYSKSLEWSIYFCILSYMFNHKYQIRPTFYMDPASLKRRFIVCGIAHTVFMPFLLLFMTLHFFMSHMYDWRTSKQYLGPREWSDLAKWTFREFNELPHVFERRLGPSYNAAEDYLKLFTQNAAMASLGRALVFVSGSLGAVLVSFAAVNDSILLHVKIGQWNLLWYVGILGVIYSVGKGMLPDVNVHPPHAHNIFAEIDNALVKVSTSTHYFPDIWKGRGWDQQTKKAFGGMFQYKAQLFALELLSVTLAPFVLCLSLPRCAEKLCHFVHKAKIDVPGAGDVCGHSSFNFDAFEDDNWEGTKIGGASDDAGGVSSDPSAGDFPYARQRNPEVKMKLRSCPKTRQGKMEKSFFSFKAAHPNWKCSSSGQSLIDRINRYQQEQERALAREMQPHIEAAARQLETLRQLEGRGQSRGVGQVNEAYIRQNAEAIDAGAGADSGGGGTFTRHDVSDTGRRMNGLANDDSRPHVHFQNTDQSQPTFGGSSLTLVSEMSNELNGDSQMAATQSHSTLGYGNSRPTSPASFAAAASVLHYGDVGLSTELRRILNRSTLDPDVSVGGSFFGTAWNSTLPSLPPMNATAESITGISAGEPETRERQAERQYLWLTRYHSHQSEEQQQ